MVLPINANILKTHKRIVAREYRNRRIGDFLKELRMTEGRGTGFPTIYTAMAENGSPVPVFETDVDSTYFLVILPAYAEVGNGAIVLLFSSMEEIIAFGNGAGNGASNGAGSLAVEILNTQIHERVTEILEILTLKMKRAELFERMELSNQSKNREKFLDPLIDIGWIEKEFPEDVTNPNQRYQATKAGKRILNLMRKGVKNQTFLSI